MTNRANQQATTAAVLMIRDLIEKKGHTGLSEVECRDILSELIDIDLMNIGWCSVCCSAGCAECQPERWSGDFGEEESASEYDDCRLAK
jgi:predicted ATP-grasp superfamily ATP-dependent carboligase